MKRGIDKVLLDTPDKMQVVQQVPVKTEKLVGSITPHKGHTLFEIDCSNGEIKPAKYESIDGLFNGNGCRKRVLVKENCLYVSCLNKKSAYKKYAAWIADRVALNIKNSIEKNGNQEKI